MNLSAQSYRTQVFRDWMDHRAVYGDVGALATELFLNPLAVGDEVELEAEPGRSFIVKLVSIGTPDDNGLTQVGDSLFNDQCLFARELDCGIHSCTCSPLLVKKAPVLCSLVHAM